MTGTLARLVALHPGQTVVAVSHANPIKTAVAHALGTHLDLFQRIAVFTASVTAIAYGPEGPTVLAVNATRGDLAPLAADEPLHANPAHAHLRPPSRATSGRPSIKCGEGRQAGGRPIRPGWRGVSMSQSFDFATPDLFTAGTIGPPGQRVFYLQARESDTLVTLKCEKEQVRVLGEYLGRLLERLAAPASTSGSDLALVEPGHAVLDRGLDRGRLRRGERPGGARHRGGPRAGRHGDRGV